jgi:ElaB/YqjD/DUF883 family membrane-anchored ribosome-binding protein
MAENRNSFDNTQTTDTGARNTGLATNTGTNTATATAPAKNFSAQAQEYGQKIADAATQAREYVTDKVGVVGDKIKDLQNKDINQVAEEAKQYARQNPGQAILISAAAGFLLGVILRGSRR